MKEKAHILPVGGVALKGCDKYALLALALSPQLKEVVRHARAVREDGFFIEAPAYRIAGPDWESLRPLLHKQIDGLIDKAKEVCP